MMSLYQSGKIGMFSEALTMTLIKNWKDLFFFQKGRDMMFDGVPDK